MQKTGERFARVRTALFGSKAFYAHVMAIIIPVVIQNTITNVVSLLDNVMVGQVGTLPMSAVAIDNQLLFVYNLCIFGGLSGAGIFATQFFGASDEDGVRHCFRFKCLVAVAMVAAAFGVFLLMPRQLISLYLSADVAAVEAEATMEYALSYLMIMLAGLPGFAMAQVYASTLRETGETELPMIASVVSIAVNLVFNYLLIFGRFGFPQLGVVGAAWATVLSRYVELMILVIAAHRRIAEFSFLRGAYASMHVPKALFWDIMVRGMPLLVNEFLWSSGIAALMQCYSARGLHVVAAANIAQTVLQLFNVLFMSVGTAVAIMVGQELGSGEGEKAKLTAYRLMTFAVLMSAATGVVLALLSPVIPKIYNTEENVRLLASDLLRIVAFIMPAHAFTHCCYFTLRAGGKTLITFLFDCVYTWVVCVACAYWLAYFTNADILVIYFAVQVVDVIKCIIGFVLVRRGVWIQNIVGGNAAA